MLTDRYLDGIPQGSRAAQGKSLDPALLTDEELDTIDRYAVDAGIDLWRRSSTS